MSNYIDSAYYYNTYNGELIPHEQIKKYVTKASNVIRNRILNRDIKNYEEIVKNTTCQVADLLFNQNEFEEKIKLVASGAEKVITSEKVGDYSRNISTTTIDDLKNLSLDIEKKIDEVIEENLFFTGLLYMGICDVR